MVGDKLHVDMRTVWVRHDNKVPNLDDFHSATRFRRSRLEENHITIEHYFRVEIFFTTIDKQLQEFFFW